MPDSRQGRGFERAGAHASMHETRQRVTNKTPKSALTRRRIMDTASSLMSERGNTAFQMGEISARCNMSKGALYYYFANKDDLLNAIYNEEISILVESIDAAVESAENAEEALNGACTAYAECMKRGGPLAMSIVRDLVLSRADDATKGEERAIHHIVNTVATQLERAKEEGVVNPSVDAHLTAVAACGAFSFVVISAIDKSGGPVELGFIEELYQNIMNGIGMH